MGQMLRTTTMELTGQDYQDMHEALLSHIELLTEMQKESGSNSIKTAIQIDIDRVTELAARVNKNISFD